MTSSILENPRLCWQQRTMEEPCKTVGKHSREPSSQT